MGIVSAQFSPESNIRGFTGDGLKAVREDSVRGATIGILLAVDMAVKNPLGMIFFPEEDMVALAGGNVLASRA